MESKSSSSPIRFAPLWLALAGLLLFLPGNNLAPLIDRDEPRFAQATREMIQRHEWVVPYFNDQYRFDKPILIYWMMRAVLRAFRRERIFRAPAVGPLGHPFGLAGFLDGPALVHGAHRVSRRVRTADLPPARDARAERGRGHAHGGDGRPRAVGGVGVGSRRRAEISLALVLAVVRRAGRRLPRQRAR